MSFRKNERSDRHEGVTERHSITDVTLQEYINQRWEDHLRVHIMERDNLRLANQVMNERLSNMNEFRDQLSRERSMYITRQEAQWMIGVGMSVTSAVLFVVFKLL